MGEWIGFIDGVVEYPGQLAITPTHPNDPLYRVNPADDGNGCDDVTDNQDTGEKPADPSDDPCAGADHRTEVRVHYGHVYQQHNMDHHSAGYGVFEYLGKDLCDQHLAKLASRGIQNNLPADPRGDHSKCILITAKDLERADRIDEFDASGTS